MLARFLCERGRGISGSPSPGCTEWVSRFVTGANAVRGDGRTQLASVPAADARADRVASRLPDYDRRTRRNALPIRTSVRRGRRSPPSAHSHTGDKNRDPPSWWKPPFSRIQLLVNHPRRADTGVLSRGLRHCGLDLQPARLSSIAWA